MQNAKVRLPEAWDCIDTNTHLLFIGSCFSENIGNDLKGLKFNATVNPFGITYNPVSAMQQLIALADNKEYKSTDLFIHQELWHSFDHHGCFSHPKQESVLEKINASLRSARKLKNPIILLTFGTGWMWTHNGVTVNNCHKRPAKDFGRELPDIQRLMNLWLEMRKRYPTNKFIVSVSPVRYDDAVANARGKALLHLFCHELEKSGEAQYFPSYEILHHELRDYRYYASDMKHPSDEAIDYIRNAFYRTACTPNAQEWIVDLRKLHQRLRHRHLHPETQAALNFQQQNQNILAQWMEKFPDKNWDFEKSLLG